MTLEVFRGPLDYTYDPIVVGFRSQCEVASYNIADAENAIDYATLHVEYIRPCSTVELSGTVEEDQTFNLNAAVIDREHRSGELQISARNPNAAERLWREDERLTGVYLEYRPSGSTEWQHALDLEGKEINAMEHESSFGFASPWWNAARLPDGVYNIRYRTACKPSSGDVPPGTDGSSSSIVHGFIDRDQPSSFGVFEPADGAYFVGDEVSFTFDEDIKCAKPFRFQVELQIDGSDELLTNNDMKIVCAGRKVSIEFDNSISFDEVNGRSASLTITHVEDLAGNVLESKVVHKFEFTTINLASATATVEVFFNRTLDIGAETPGTAASRVFKLDLAREIATVLGISSSTVAVESVSRVSDGALAVVRLSSTGNPTALELGRQLLQILRGKSQPVGSPGSLLQSAPQNQPTSETPQIERFDRIPSKVFSSTSASSSTSEDFATLKALLISVFVLGIVNIALLVGLFILYRSSHSNRLVLPKTKSTSPVPAKRVTPMEAFYAEVDDGPMGSCISNPAYLSSDEF